MLTARRDPRGKRGMIGPFRGRRGLPGGGGGLRSYIRDALTRPPRHAVYWQPGSQTLGISSAGIWNRRRDVSRARGGSDVPSAASPGVAVVGMRTRRPWGLIGPGCSRYALPRCHSAGCSGVASEYHCSSCDAGMLSTAFCRWIRVSDSGCCTRLSGRTVVRWARHRICCRFQPVLT